MAADRSPESGADPIATILKASEIIDVNRLVAALDTVLGEEQSPTTGTKCAVLDLMKQAIASGQAEVRRRFEESASGAETVAANSYLMDSIIRSVFDFTLGRVYPAGVPTAGEHICLAAVGGYGRGELAPFSDLDLLFLIPYKETARLEQIIEYMLYLLWDCGLKVGHATRSLDECIRLSRDDYTIRTAVLESRPIAGDEKLFVELQQRFKDEVVADTGAKFVEAKLAERDMRHQRMGDSRYVLEPNIKDGKGGLRDLQTLFWIAKYLYGADTVDELVEHGALTARESARFAKAQNFLWAVRCHLHYLANRGEDRLTFDLQTEISKRMSYRAHAGTSGVERFMKHYYLTAKEVGDLTRIFCATLEAEHGHRPPFSWQGLNVFRREIEGFDAKSGRLSFTSGRQLQEDPVSIIRLFHAAQAQDLDIHPSALRAITRNLRLIDGIRDDAEANRLFMEMMISPKGPEITLRRLNEAGVMGRFIPDFGRVVAQMQHDMYHVYTVDEHTIFAIGILFGVEQGRFKEDMPASSEAVHKIKSRKALYAGLLLHDIGKGRGGNHSEIGADIALRLCPRLGLTAEETETAAWLVRHHLMLSNAAFHRDINDPQTIRDLVETVQSAERLRLLLALTVSDIRAVGPNVWNAWKAGLIRDLFYSAEEALTGGYAAEGKEDRVEAAREDLTERLHDWLAEEIEEHLTRGYASYWLSFDAETHARHAEFVRAAEAGKAPLTVDMRLDDFRGVTEVTIYTGDHPGLFSSIAGAMVMSGANIVDAKIATMTNGKALDVFWVQDADGAMFSRTAQLDRLKKNIEQTLTGKINPARELSKRRALPSRTRVFTVAPRVMTDNSASRTHSLIEVNGRDRPGLLHDVTRVLTDMGLQISNALITTYGERAVDVFYVKDAFGMQVANDAKLKQISEVLLGALADPDAAKDEAPKKKRGRGSPRAKSTGTPKKKQSQPARAGRGGGGAG